MKKIICPVCGEFNDPIAEQCQACNASLSGIDPIEVGDETGLEEAKLEHFSQEENDLPGLLHALKHDGEMDASENDQMDQNLQEGSNLEDIFAEDLEEEEEKVPEWLNRIRQRASEEPDSVGEVTQKIATALENLAEEKSSDQHEDFKTWLERVRSEEHSAETEEEKTQEEPASTESEEDWLMKIRKAEGKFPEDDEADQGEGLSEDQKGDSLLQWLVALEEERKQGPKGAEPLVEPGGLSEETRPTEVFDETEDVELAGGGGLAEDSDSIYVERPSVDISREEQLRADYLSAVIMEEKKAQPSPELKSKSKAWAVRLGISLILIASLILSMFLFPGADPGLDRIQPHNRAVISWLEDLPSDASVLLVFDYQAGYASELTLVAQPVIASMIEKNVELTILSSSPSGGLLSGRLLRKTPGAIDRVVMDLGYFPVGAYGAFNLAHQAQEGPMLANLPEAVKTLPTGELDGILILADGAAGARAWLEQFSILLPTTPMHLLLTAQAGPMSLPYWESGQLAGMIAGLSEAAGVEAVLSQNPVIPGLWRAHQVGLMFFILLLLLAVIFFGKKQPKTNQEGNA